MELTREQKNLIEAIQDKTTASISKTLLAEKLGITRMGLFLKLKSGNFSAQEKKILRANGIEWRTFN